MKKSFLAVITIFTLASCSQKEIVENPTAKKDSVQITTEPEPEELATNCYFGVNDQDSIALSYEDNLGTITGKISIKTTEVPRTQSDIMGFVNGDTLKVTYQFGEENNLEDKEIWFLKKGKSVIEAVGKYDASGLKYANYKNITFTGTELKPKKCEDLEKELK